MAAQALSTFVAILIRRAAHRSHDNRRRVTILLKLPTSVKTAAARLAKADGVSLNQFIAAAVAEKVGVIETAREFLERRAGEAKLNEVEADPRALHFAGDVTAAPVELLEDSTAVRLCDADALISHRDANRLVVCAGTCPGGCWSTTHTSGLRPRARCSREWRRGGGKRPRISDLLDRVLPFIAS